MFRKFDKLVLSTRLHELVPISVYSIKDQIFLGLSENQDTTTHELFNDRGKLILNYLSSAMDIRCPIVRQVHGLISDTHNDACCIDCDSYIGNLLDQVKDEPEETKYLLERRINYLNSAWFNPKRIYNCKENILGEGQQNNPTAFLSIGKIDYITQYCINHSYWSNMSRAFLAAEGAVRSFLAVPMYRVCSGRDISDNKVDEFFPPLSKPFQLLTFIPLPRHTRGKCIEHGDYSGADHLRKILYYLLDTSIDDPSKNIMDDWNEHFETPHLHEEEELLILSNEIKIIKKNILELESNSPINGSPSENSSSLDEMLKFKMKHYYELMNSFRNNCYDYELKRLGDDNLRSWVERKAYDDERLLFRDRISKIGMTSDDIDVFLTLSMRYPIMVRSSFEHPDSAFKFITILRDFPKLIPDTCSIIILRPEYTTNTLADNKPPIIPSLDSITDRTDKYSSLTNNILDVLHNSGIKDASVRQLPYYWDLVAAFNMHSRDPIQHQLISVSNILREMKGINRTAMLFEYKACNESLYVNILIKAQFGEIVDPTVEKG